MNLTNALKWSFLSEIASKAIQPVIFILLARLLTPEDFGVMSAALMIIGFSQVFWEAGMGKALIQRQTDIDDAANAAFWINLGLGSVIVTGLCVIAKPVAWTFFKDERVTLVLQVMTLQVFLGALAAVHTALLQKEMGFKPLFWVRFATVSLPGLASIPLAWNGMGYWALVVGTLVGQLVQVIMLWFMSAWRPRWAFNTRVAKEMGSFGVWVGVSGMLAWFYIWADSLIVGMYLGGYELGLYRTGNQFASMIFSIIFGPIVPVLYSHLARMSLDKIQLARVVENLIRVLAAVAIPIAFIIFSLANPIGSVMFGIRWQGINLVIGVMALMHGYSWIAGMNGEVYRAMGKPSYESIVNVITLVIYLIIYLISIRQGFQVFVWTRLGLALGAVVMHMLVLRKVLSIAFMPIVSYILGVTMLAGIIVMTTRLVTSPYINSEWWQLVTCGTLNVVIAGIAIYLLERKQGLRQIVGLVRVQAR